MKEPPPSITLGAALLPLGVLILLLSVNIVLFGHDVLQGPSQVALLLAAIVAAGIACWKGCTWEQVETGMVAGVSSTIPAILILLLIGALSGTWLLSGIVPAMVYYGLQLLHPTYLPLIACILCSALALVIGSSWSTLATLGVALVGVGKAMGWPEEIIAGAAISGAYFGNKLSPLADTTVLAAGLTGVTTTTHIRYLLITSIPALILSLLLFGLLGFTYTPLGASENMLQYAESIRSYFHITPWLFVVPLIMIGMILKNVPSLPTLFIGTVLGGWAAGYYQPHLLLQLTGHTQLTGASVYHAIIQAMGNTVTVSTGHASLDQLFVSGGMAGMLPTVWLVLGAAALSGVMEVAGMLAVIAQRLTPKVHTVGALTASTTGACIFFNLVFSDQHLALLIPGKMYAPVYKKAGLLLQNLGRTLEDTATVTSPLIPWSCCGATQAMVLGVATGSYAPYCFFCWLSPLVGIAVAYLSFRIARVETKPGACVE